MNLLNIATILCIGLLIGAEFAVSAFINPVVWKLDPAAQAARPVHDPDLCVAVCSLADTVFELS